MIELLSAAATGVPLLAGWSWHAVRLRRKAATARRDPLTGLPTRAEFYERGGATLKHGPRAVVVIDLDGFKAVNDTYGHAAGDEVIRTVGERLTRWAEQGGGIVARLGGDEFAAVLPAYGYADVEWTMAQLGRFLAAPVAYEGAALPVGYSAGVVWRHPSGAVPGLTPWLRRADEAMYAAKRAGGGWHLAVGPVPVAETVRGRRVGRAGTSEVSA
ncbi:GGDEF domain-containing protein [Streptomyces sp. NPDC001661]